MASVWGRESRAEGAGRSGMSVGGTEWANSAAHARATFSVSLMSSEEAIIVGVEIRKVGRDIDTPVATQVAWPTGNTPP